MVDHDSEELSSAPDGRPQCTQPAWRQAFPIDAPQDRYVARRDFTKFMVLTSLAFVAGQLWIGILHFFRRRQETPVKQRIAALEEVPVGSAMVFHYPNEDTPCLLLRPDQNSILAYGQKCSHLSCAVVPDTENRLRCPCHHGQFDVATGRPLAGPPRRPLPRILLEQEDGIIYAVGIEERTV